MISYQKAKELKKAGFLFPESVLVYTPILKDVVLRKTVNFEMKQNYISLPDANDLIKLLPRGFNQNVSQGFREQHKWVEFFIKKVTAINEKDYDVAGYFSIGQLSPTTGNIWFCNSNNDMSFEDILAMLILKLRDEDIIK